MLGGDVQPATSTNASAKGMAAALSGSSIFNFAFVSETAQNLSHCKN